ncbi:UNVERIFIED_ORG: acetyltransferase (GNAT) family protein [Gordonia westfalica J30]
MSEASTLTTPRLRLRPPEDRDIEPIVEACQDPGIQRFTLLPSPFTRADAEKFVREISRAEGSRVWTIELLDGGFVGVTGLHSRGEGVASLGYWCAAWQRGRGSIWKTTEASEFSARRRA